MDESLLVSKGMRPTELMVGYVDGYGLHIGERATLVPEPGRRAYGVLTKIPADAAVELYADPSVADYIAQPVAVKLPEGIHVSAVTYNLPASQLSGTNPEYAESLLALATKLGLPDSYIDHIRTYVTAS